LEVKNNCDRNALTSQLRACRGVNKVELSRETDGSYIFNVYGERGVDLREQISSKVSEQKAVLLSMQAKQSTLEDVFRELTR
jgi:hypothetical protein